MPPPVERIMYTNFKGAKVSSTEWQFSTTTLSTTTYTQPIDIDSEYPWLYDALLWTVIISNFVLPWIIWGGFIFFIRYHEKRQERHDEMAEEKWVKHRAEKVNEYKRGHPGVKDDDQEFQRFAHDLDETKDDFLEQNTHRQTGCCVNATEKPIGRLCSLNCSICMWICIIFFAIFHILDGPSYSENIQAVVWIALWIAVADYVYILLESCCSLENKYLDTFKDAESAVLLIQKIRAQQAVIMLYVTNFHYETNVRYVTYRDSQGRSETRRETYTYKVVSSSDTEIFRYGYWVDNSPKAISKVNKRGVTKLKVERDVIMGDGETVSAFDNACENIRSRNRNRDTYMDFNMEYFISGYKKRVATFLDKNTIPCWLNKIGYWIFTLLGLTWLFRILFGLSSGHAIYPLTKHIYMSPPLGQEYNIYDSSEEDAAHETLAAREQSDCGQDDPNTQAHSDSPDGVDTTDRVSITVHQETTPQIREFN